MERQQQPGMRSCGAQSSVQVQGLTRPEDGSVRSHQPVDGIVKLQEAVSCVGQFFVLFHRFTFAAPPSGVQFFIYILPRGALASSLPLG